METYIARLKKKENRDMTFEEDNWSYLLSWEKRMFAQVKWAMKLLSPSLDNVVFFKKKLWHI
jgi:hypothetical protein